MVTRRAFVAGLGAGMALPAFGKAEAAASRLRVQGNRLYDGSNAVRLRGVGVNSPYDRSGWGSFKGWNRPTSDYRTIRNVWRANVVRIAVYPGEWRDHRSDMSNALYRDVSAARAAGLYVIIDWHTQGWPDGWFLIPPGGSRDYDTGMKLARTFWDYAARTYGRDGGIVFELWNEPTKNWNVAGHNGEWWRLKPYLAELLGIVRRYSPNVVLATGRAAAYDLRSIRANLLADPNVAYSWHVYPDVAARDGGLSWTAALDNLHTVRPVVVTEWGFRRHTTEHFQGTPQSFGIPFMGFVNPRSLHWTAWLWHAADEYGLPLLGGPGVVPNRNDWCRPSEYGAFVLQQLGAPTPVCR